MPLEPQIVQITARVPYSAIRDVEAVMAELGATHKGAGYLARLAMFQLLNNHGHPQDSEKWGLD